MAVNPAWVSAIADSVIAIGVIFAWLQLRDSHDEIKTARGVLETARQTLESQRNQIVDDHERSRREGAVQYVLVWTNSVTRAFSSASTLIEKLDFATCQKIVSRQSIRIHKEHVDLLIPSFPPETKFEEAGDAFILTVQQTAEFRALVVKYLNLLETIMCAWWFSSVDKKIIEMEFQYLMEPTQGRNILRDFRQAIGDSSYPAIQAFEQHMAEQKKAAAASGGKPPLGGNPSQH